MLYKNRILLNLALIIMGLSSTILKAEPLVGESMRVVPMFWSKPSPEKIAKHLMFAANLVSERKLETDIRNLILKEHDALQKWSAPFKGEPELKVKVLPEFNEIRVVNKALVDHLVKKDIGEKNAVKIAYQHLKKLMEAGMINQRSFNPKDLQIGYGRIIQGSKDGKEKQDEITEYRITFRPNIDGIQLANSGVRVAVHRSGSLSGLRFGGVSANETDASQVIRTISNDGANRQILKMLPDDAEPSLAWSRLMYVMPENTKSAKVEPTQVYAYSLKTKSDGLEVISRRKIVGVSLSTGDLIDFTAPALKHDVQKKIRDEES